ncbi:MAG: DUF3301 domain-containing protein [Rhodanobacter sp.]
MSNLTDMLVLLALGATIGAWMKLSTAREYAVREARAQCQRHGVQLLDETVGLRRVRVRRVNGQRHLERCYGFEVSVAGNDRAPGRLWMIGRSLTSLSLPSVEHPADVTATADNAQATSNVVMLSETRRRSGDRQH